MESYETGKGEKGIANISQIISLLLMLVSTIVDVNDMVKDLNLLLKKAQQDGRDVTDEELDELNKKVSASREKLAKLLQ